ncbi:hypothetical protein Avbf_16315 [Armadillidium vulgare]|nr:hypothetical protein Avbf_16315 [Armadillidium vulgare]
MKLLKKNSKGSSFLSTTKLLDCGVEDEYDLKYVEEKDLCEILKPIHVRKLLKSWKIAVKNRKLGCRVYNGNFFRNTSESVS